MSRRVLHFTSIDSTMRAAADLDIGGVVVADEQTAGQGRHGHGWHSPAGSGLYCSMVLKPNPVLTLALGLAAVEAIEKVAGVRCDIRWPNDVMLDSRKVAGILVQIAGDKAIAGIGINLNQTSFPPDLAAIATSLRIHTGREIPRDDLLAALVPAVDSLAGEDPETVLRLFARASSYAAGRRVTVDLPDGVIEGITAGLNPEGFLIVRRDDGTETLILAGGVRATGS
jgi:BirA family transcriptional regulator, biotin operon repressor / biotin---[acetyl-CoA-carboxylase] ligase